MSFVKIVIFGTTFEVRATVEFRFTGVESSCLMVGTDLAGNFPVLAIRTGWDRFVPVHYITYISGA